MKGKKLIALITVLCMLVSLLSIVPAFGEGSEDTYEADSARFIPIFTETFQTAEGVDKTPEDLKSDWKFHQTPVISGGKYTCAWQAGAYLASLAEYGSTPYRYSSTINCTGTNDVFASVAIRVTGYPQIEQCNGVPQNNGISVLPFKKNDGGKNLHIGFTYGPKGSPCTFYAIPMPEGVTFIKNDVNLTIDDFGDYVKIYVGPEHTYMAKIELQKKNPDDTHYTIAKVFDAAGAQVTGTKITSATDTGTPVTDATETVQVPMTGVLGCSNRNSPFSISNIVVSSLKATADDKAVLEAKFAAIDDLTEADYMTASWAALMEAVDAGQAVLEKMAQGEELAADIVNDAIKAIDDAVAALTLIAEQGLTAFSIGGVPGVIDGENITFDISNLVDLYEIGYTLKFDTGKLQLDGKDINNGDILEALPSQATLQFTGEGGVEKTYRLTIATKNAKIAVPANATKVYSDDLESYAADSALNGQGKWTSANNDVVLKKDVFGNKGNSAYLTKILNVTTEMNLEAEEQIAAPFLFTGLFYDNGISKHNMAVRVNYSNGKVDFLAASIGGTAPGVYELRLEGNGTRVEFNGVSPSTTLNVPREKGWHEFAVMADEDLNMSYYIDGVRLVTSEGVPFSYKLPEGTKLKGGGVSFAGWGGDSNLYFDDFTFYQLVARTEIPGIIEKPEEGTLTDAIKAAAAEAGISGEMTVNYGMPEIGGATIDADGTLTLPEGVYGQYSGTVEYTISVDSNEVARGTAKVSATGGDAVAADSAVFDGWTQEEGGVSTTEAKTATFAFYAKAGTGIGIGTKIGVTFGRVQVIVKDSTGTVVATDKIDLFFPLQAVSKAIVVSNTVDNGDGTITVTPFAAEADGKYTVEIKAEGVGYTDISNKVFVTGVTLNQ